MGRPARILTPGELAKYEAEAHRLDSNDDIAAYFEVSRATIARWLKAGRALPPGDPDFRRQFCDIVQHAREGSKRTLLGVLTRAAIAGDVSAAKYLLDRVHRLATHVALQNPDGSAIGASSTGPSPDDLAGLSTDDLRAFHAAQAMVLELGQRAIEAREHGA